MDRTTQTAEKEKAIFNYYTERREYYRANELLRDIRVSKLYEEVADRFYISSGHASKIILKKIKGEK